MAETWVMAHPDTNHVVDITDRFATKVEALRAHESQTAHMDDLESRLREWGAAQRRGRRAAARPAGRAVLRGGHRA